MEVSCPTCHNKVTVPPTDAPDVDQPAARKDPLFEGSDLDALLKPAAAAPPRELFRPPPPQPTAPSAAFDPGPVQTPVPLPPAGVVLTTRQATILAVGAVLILGAAFAAGLVIGRFMP